jgi:pimeloyl-ACP methyl ester carboxylesterase
MRPVIAVMCRPASLRRVVLRDSACNGNRITAERAIQMLDDYLACTVVSDVVDGTFQVAPLNPLPCPTTIAWSGCDKLLPIALCEKNVRERLPQAVFKVLPDVGHVPMFDDPDLVARTILTATGAANS